VYFRPFQRWCTHRSRDTQSERKCAHPATPKVKEIRISPDARRALSCAYDNSLRVWNLQTGKCKRKLGGQKASSFADGQIFDCCWFPDESPDATQVLSCGGDAKLKIWDTAGPAQQPLELTGGKDGHKKAIRSCCLFSRGTKVLSCSKDATLKVWDVASGKVEKTLSGADGHKDLIDRCCVLSDGDDDAPVVAISCSWDKTLKIWGLDAPAEGQECLKTLQDNNKVRGCAVYNYGKRLVSTGSGPSASRDTEQLSDRAHRDASHGNGVGSRNAAHGAASGVDFL
jgi:WD40 repeat protein